MLFRMHRTQTDGALTLHAGVAYDASQNPALATLARVYVTAGLAEEVTAAQLKKEKAAAEKLSPVSPAPSADAGAEGGAGAEGDAA